MGELVGGAAVQCRGLGVRAGGAAASAGPAAAWGELNAAQEERPEHRLWQRSLPFSCSVIISQVLCFCVMQCKFLEAAVPAMKDQLVVILGELTRLYLVVTESHPGVVCIMSRDGFFHQESGDTGKQWCNRAYLVV